MHVLNFTQQPMCPDIQTLAQDLSDWQGTRTAVQSLGHFDLLVNNAGVGKLDAFLDVTEKDIDFIFSINYKGLFNVSQVVAQGMVDEGRGGAIVNISSVASKMGLLNHAVYCSSKGAVDSLTQVMALELGPKNIRVNAVNPTVVLTDMGRMAWSDPAKAGPIMARIPLGKFVEIEDVTNVVLFLLSDKASMIHGATVPVEGGLLAN